MNRAWPCPAIMLPKHTAHVSFEESITEDPEQISVGFFNFLCLMLKITLYSLFLFHFLFGFTDVFPWPLTMLLIESSE